MAKKYSQAEWSRLQSRLPEEDRVPYSESPDAPAQSPTRYMSETTRAGMPTVATTTTTPPPPGRYYNYYTGEYVDDPSKIVPRTGMGGAESDGGVIQVEETGPTGTPTGSTGVFTVGADGYLYKDGKPFSGEYPVGSGKFYLNGEIAPISSGAQYFGTRKTSEQLAAEQAALIAAEEKRRIGQSAYDLLFSEFDSYGMGALVEPLRALIQEGLSRDELTLRLRGTDAYKKRFAANSARVQKGLRALSEAEYIGLEDQYQEIMRNYGLPTSYYSRGDMGRQEGFERLIANDVSNVELEDRIATAQNRVINAAPEVSRALREFYPDITGGDILAYALDPEQGLNNIKRKVTAAEIGAGAMQAGLGTSVTRAEELARFGVTGEQARQGFQTIGGFLPRAEQLGSIYGKQGMGPYTQATAEAEVFGTTGAVDAERKRKQLAQLESAQFSGQVGATGGALGRERAGQF